MKTVYIASLGIMGLVCFWPSISSLLIMISHRLLGWLMAFYRRLVERGKPHKVALIAAMRKLLAAVY